MQINPKIKETLDKFGIHRQDGVLALLAIHYNCVASYIPPLLWSRLSAAKIVNISEQGSPQIILPLFEDTEIPKNWEWIKEWRQMFADKSPQRKGTLSTCVTRMKTFFAENPDIRKEDVMEATRMYLKTQSKGSNYVTTSHKFIFDGAGKNRNSGLEQWVETYIEALEITSEEGTMDITNTMQ